MSGYAPLLAALMGRIAEFTPEQLASLQPLMEHSQSNVDRDLVVPMPEGKSATSYTAGVNMDGSEMLIPTAWGGEIVDIETAIKNALDQRQDWPKFDDPARASRAANLASSLMGYQSK